MPESVVIEVPDIGDFDEVEIIEVLVSKGQRVAAEDPLITLESDKATMDIPAPSAGVITELRVEVGQTVSQGTPIALLDAAQPGQFAKPADEAPEKLAEVETPAADASPPPEPTPQPEQPPPKTPEPRPADAYRPPPTLPPPVERAGLALPHASPAIRRFARELGAPLSQIRGSGTKGRILKEDIKAWVQQSLSAPAPAGGIPALPEIDFSPFGEVETRPLSRIAKLSGAHLQRAWLNIPHVTHHDEADITDLEAFRRSLKPDAEKAGVRVTVLGFAVAILARALAEFPTFNASLHPDGKHLIVKKYCNIGIAVDTPHGLVVPVIKGADRKGVLALAAEMGALSERARTGRLQVEEMRGGCISISSIGGIGGTAFTPIVNAPEVAILGITRARMTPVWDGAEFRPRLMLPLDLSYDHRVIDGAEAARFTARLVELFGDVRRLLL